MRGLVAVDDRPHVGFGQAGGVALGAHSVEVGQWVLLQVTPRVGDRTAVVAWQSWLRCEGCKAAAAVQVQGWASPVDRSAALSRALGVLHPGGVPV